MFTVKPIPGDSSGLNYQVSLGDFDSGRIFPVELRLEGLAPALLTNATWTGSCSCTSEVSFASPSSKLSPPTLKFHLHTSGSPGPESSSIIGYANGGPSATVYFVYNKTSKWQMLSVDEWQFSDEPALHWAKTIQFHGPTPSPKNLQVDYVPLGQSGCLTHELIPAGTSGFRVVIRSNCGAANTTQTVYATFSIEGSSQAPLEIPLPKTSDAVQVKPGTVVFTPPAPSQGLPPPVLLDLTDTPVPKHLYSVVPGSHSSFEISLRDTPNAVWIQHLGLKVLWKSR